MQVSDKILIQIYLSSHKYLLVKSDPIIKLLLLSVVISPTRTSPSSISLISALALTSQPYLKHFLYHHIIHHLVVGDDTVSKLLP